MFFFSECYDIGPQLDHVMTESDIEQQVAHNRIKIAIREAFVKQSVRLTN